MASKKQDPILGWTVENAKGPIGRPLLRAVNPDGGKNDYIEASHDETEDGLLVAREAIERAILRERVRLAKDGKEKTSAQAELDDFSETLRITRGARSALAARRAILEK
jgi:hypothetical protein